MFSKSKGIFEFKHKLKILESFASIQPTMLKDEGDLKIIGEVRDTGSFEIVKVDDLEKEPIFINTDKKEDVEMKNEEKFDFSQLNATLAANQIQK